MNKFKDNLSRIQKGLRMYKRAVYLNISDIASFIGQNKWDFVTPFERLWKRCDHAGYQTALATLQERLHVQKVELVKLEQEQMTLQSELEQKKITKRQFTIANSKIDAEKQELSVKVEDNVDKIEKIDLTQQQFLERVVGKELMTTMQDAVIETNDKRVHMQEAIDKLEVSKEKKENIRKQTESFINKTHGTIKEQGAIEMFEEKFKVKLDTTQDYFKRKIDAASANSAFDWYIGGKMDGIFKDGEDPSGNYVVEVKNRTKSFFSSIRDYELTQIQMYMWIADMPKAYLVEKYGNKIRTTRVYKDEAYLNNVLDYLKIFVSSFETDFLEQQEVKNDYVSHTDVEKKGILRRMYINRIQDEINRRLELALESDLDSDSDDECLIKSD